MDYRSTKICNKVEVKYQKIGQDDMFKKKKRIKKPNSEGSSAYQGAVLC